jgi:alpha-tubulin suppressor-like RCC1 family protein
MRSALTLSAVVIATATTLVHCASHDERLGAVEDAGWSEDAASEAEADAGADALDAATEDEFEIPDGSVTCEASPCAVALSGSFGNSSLASFCALLDDKTVQCWGSNLQMRLGYETDGGAFGGAFPMSSAPHRVSNLSGVTSVSVGGDNACARKEDGSILCWGLSELVGAGMSPDAGPPPASGALPTRMDLVPLAKDVAVGTGTACVTSATGGLSCWGKNGSFQLARRTSEPLAGPSEIPVGGRAVARPAPGDGSMFAVTTSGELLSWGGASCAPPFTCAFMLGRDTSEDPDPVPALVPNLSKVRAVAAASQHACTIAGRYVECWGANERGQLGRGTPGDVSELPAPTMLSLVIDAEDADAGLPHRADIPLQIAGDETRTCAVMGSGRVYCWGDDVSFTGMGGSPQPQSEWGRPIRVDGLSGPAVALSLTVTTSCALLRSGVVECWGGNLLGSLGRGIDDIEFADLQPAPVNFER